MSGQVDKNGQQQSGHRNCFEYVPAFFSSVGIVETAVEILDRTAKDNESCVQQEKGEIGFCRKKLSQLKRLIPSLAQEWQRNGSNRQRGCRVQTNEKKIQQSIG